MTKSTRLAMPTSPSLAPRRSKRKIRIQSDSEDSGNDIEEGNVTKQLSNIPSASEKKPRVVRRRQLIPENDAGVEQGNGNVSDTDIAADATSGAESTSSQTLASTNRPRIHNCTWPNCDKVFDNKGKLSEHIRTHTGERPYACPVEGCGKCYVKNSQLQVHALTHDENALTAFRCPMDYCEAAFASKYRLKRHLKLHEESDVACDWEGCGATFLKPFQLRNHMCIHTNKKPHPCTHEGCDRSFDTRPKLNAHTKAVHSKELRYCCGHEGCDAKFAKYTELQQHDKHDHEHKCTICGKVYETRPNLAYHISTVHLQQELFACHWDGCKKEFKMQSSLRFHINNTHRNIKPHKCEYDNCDAAYPTAQGLRRHIKINHEPKEDQRSPPPPPDFSVLTGYSENTTKRESRIFSCPFDKCGMTFWREYDLKRHIESKSHESELSQEVQNVQNLNA